MIKICSKDGCNNKIRAGKLCTKHLREEIGETCIIDGCDRIAFTRGYCRKHYNRLLIYGDASKRTIYDKNEIKIIGDICKMSLYDVKGNIIGETIFDLEDFDRVKDKKWGKTDGKHDDIYVCSRSFENNKHTSLHRFIMNAKDGDVVDHINGNTVDNRKSNLRIVTNSQNAMNAKISSLSKSGYKGVSYMKRYNKWRAYIKYNGKQEHLGVFDDIGEAVNARQIREDELFVEYSRLRVTEEG